LAVFNRKIIAFFDDRESRKTVPKFSRFLKLYWTELITGGAKIIADPVRVEFFQGPRSYEIFARVTPPVVRSDIERTIGAQQRLNVAGDRSYIELIARTDESVGRLQYCEDQIDRVVTQLSALLSPSLFARSRAPRRRLLADEGTAGKLGIKRIAEAVSGFSRCRSK